MTLNDMIGFSEGMDIDKLGRMFLFQNLMNKFQEEEEQEIMTRQEQQVEEQPMTLAQLLQLSGPRNILQLPGRLQSALAETT